MERGEWSLRRIWRQAERLQAGLGGNGLKENHGAQWMQPLLPLFFPTCSSSQSLLPTYMWARVAPSSLPCACCSLLILPKLLKKGEGTGMGVSLDSVPVVGGRNMDGLRRQGRVLEQLYSHVESLGGSPARPCGAGGGDTAEGEQASAHCVSCRECGQTQLLHRLSKSWWELEESQCWARRKPIKKIILVKK